MATLNIGGRKVTVDDAFLQLAPDQQAAVVEEIAASSRIAGPAPAAQPQGMSGLETAGDVAASGGIGLLKGGIGQVGLGGDIREGVTAGANWLASKLRGQSLSEGITGPQPAISSETVRDVLRRSPGIMGALSVAPTSGQVRQKVEGVTGPLYEPKSVPGEYAQTGGEFAVGALGPGGPLRRVVAGVAAPAIASETAGQYFKNTAAEPYARVAAALAGGAGGSVAASAIPSRGAVPGVTRGASRALVRDLEPDVGPTAEAKLRELGPEAFLAEATPSAMIRAQGIAARPGPGSHIVNAVTGRQAATNARLNADIDAQFGRAEIPSEIERGLEVQRRKVAEGYAAATAGQQSLNPAPIIKQMDADIAIEAGRPKKVVQEIKGFLYNQVRYKDGDEWKTKNVLKTSVDELLNARQATDDLINQLGDAPNANRLASKYRTEIDKLMPVSVKVVDAKFSELKKQSAALERGRDVLRSGETPMRPRELETELGDMSPLAQSHLRAGVRADIDRMLGTTANDINAVKKFVQGGGDYNREKLAQVFGQVEADRIFKATDREVAFRDAYNKLVQNSQTAQRQAGMASVQAENAPVQIPAFWTRFGQLPEMAARAGGERIADLLARGPRASTERDLARAYATQGGERDELIRAIRDAATRRMRAPNTRDELVRLLFGAQAATTPERMK